MTIKIFENSIEFDDFALVVSPQGISAINKGGSSSLVGFSVQDFLRLPGTPTQGKTYGYISGGFSTSGPLNVETSIANVQKFNFAASGGNSISVSNLRAALGRTVGQTSGSAGYTSAGRQNPGFNIDVIKYITSYFSDKTIVAGGIVSTPINPVVSPASNQGKREGMSGHSSTTHGYVTGGQVNFTNPPNLASFDDMQKFPFATDINSTLVGSLTSAGGGGFQGLESLTSGYNLVNRATASPAPTEFTFGVECAIINKFPFASDVNATGVGFVGAPNILIQRPAGISAEGNGYIVGGYNPTILDRVTTISRIQFSNDSYSNNISNMGFKRSFATGLASISEGYICGGVDLGIPPASPSPRNINTTERFPFASEQLIYSVGSLAAHSAAGAGFQY